MTTGKRLNEFIKKLAEIDREKGKTENIVRFLKDFTQENSLDFWVDEWGNVVICKNTLPEISPVAVVVQSSFSPFKTKKARRIFFRKNSNLVRKGAYIQVRKSNFGAVGLAGMAVVLELLSSDVGVNVEVIFTPCDENFLSFKNFNFKKLNAKRVVCIDGFNDATLYLSSAESANVEVKFKTEKEFIVKSKEDKTFRLFIGGLAGESMGKIGEKKNAIKFAGELLSKIDSKKINSFFVKSGVASVVPSSAEVTFTTSMKDESLKKIMWHHLFWGKKTNKDLAIKCVRMLDNTLVCPSFDSVLKFLFEVEQGEKKRENAGIVVQNSFKLDSEKGIFCVNILSDNKDLLKMQVKYLSSLCEKYGFSWQITEEHPSFKAREDCEFIDQLKRSYVGILPLKTSVLMLPSAAGILREKDKNMQLAILGVKVENPQSTNEKLLFSSVINLSLWLKNFFEKSSQNI